MSRTVCTYPIVSALLKADDIIGAGREWRPGPGLKRLAPEQFRTQERYLRNFHAPQSPEIPGLVASATTPPEIEAIASLSADEINRWLAARKFRITLNPFPPHGFGTASILDVRVAWQEEGLKVPVRLSARRETPGVLLKPGVRIVSTGTGPAAEVQTKSGDTVYMLPGKTDREGLDLMEFVMGTELGETDYDYRGVHFPMVDLDEEPDISWLKELYTEGEDGHGYEVAQAKQQTKFRMNEKGARARSGVAIGIVRTTAVEPPPKPPLVINGPFTLWISRPGLSTPFLAAHLTDECFKEPASLDDM